jgi:carboxypeptidase D
MKRFLKKFPELRDYNVFLGGESFAGSYLPQFYLDLKDLFHIDALIGMSPWIDYRNQYLSFIEYSKIMGLITSEPQELKQQEKRCHIELERNPNRPTISSCDHIVEIIHQQYIKSKNLHGSFFNQYKINELDSNRGNNWPNNLEALTNYFNNKETIAALNAGNFGKEKWKEVNGEIYGDFESMISDKSAVELYADLTKQTRVIIVAGEMDLVSNRIGLEWAIGNLTWNGMKGFSKTEGLKEETASKLGRIVSERNLTYIMVTGASHMMGVDQPAQMKVLLNAILNNDFDVISSSSDTFTGKAHEENAEEPPHFPYMVVFWAAIILMTLFGLWYLKRKRYRYRNLNRSSDDSLYIAGESNNRQQK